MSAGSTVILTPSGPSTRVWHPEISRMVIVGSTGNLAWLQSRYSWMAGLVFTQTTTMLSEMHTDFITKAKASSESLYSADRRVSTKGEQTSTRSTRGTTRELTALHTWQQCNTWCTSDSFPACKHLVDVPFNHIPITMVRHVRVGVHFQIFVHYKNNYSFFFL